jgi:hypothetical protein
MGGCLLTAPPRSYFESGGAGGAQTTTSTSAAGGGGENASGGQHPGSGGGDAGTAPTLIGHWPGTSLVPFPDPTTQPGDLLLLVVLVDDNKTCSFDFHGWNAPAPATHGSNTDEIELHVAWLKVGATKPALPSICSGSARWAGLLVQLRSAQFAGYKPDDGNMSQPTVPSMPAHTAPWLPLFFVGNKSPDEVFCGNWTKFDNVVEPGKVTDIEVTGLTYSGAGQPALPSKCHAIGWVSVMVGIDGS